MAKLDYEQFKTVVADTIKEHLPDEYWDYTTRFQMVQKSGYEYEALMIEPREKTGTIITPALNITEAFKKYNEGECFYDVVERLARVRVNTRAPKFCGSDFFDFEKVKDRIFPRLVNSETNKAYLADKPHRSIEDLSIIYSMRVEENEHSLALVTVTDSILDLWNITEEELHDIAVENLSKTKPFICELRTALFGGFETGGLSIDDLNDNEYEIPFFILTSQNKTHGAIMAMNTAVMDRLTEKLGKLYILPSSVEEVIIAPQTAVDDVQFLSNLVKSANETDLRPEDKLSDNVYEYDIETHNLKIVM